VHPIALVTNSLEVQANPLALVSQRRRMLDYLRRNSPERYQALIQRLGLRR